MDNVLGMDRTKQVVKAFQTALKAALENMESQVGFAEKANISPGYLSEIALGHKRGSKEIWERIASALSTTIEDMVVPHLGKTQTITGNGNVQAIDSTVNKDRRCSDNPKIARICKLLPQLSDEKLDDLLAFLIDRML